MSDSATPSTSYTRQRTDWQVYRRLLTYIRPHLVVFIIAILGLVGYAIADAGMAYVMKPLLDDGFTRRDEDMILLLPLLIVGLFVLRGGAGFISNYGMAYVGLRVITTLREQTFNKYLYLDNRYYDTHNTGEMISRLIFNIEQIGQSITGALAQVVRELLTIIFLMGLMIALSPKLAAIIFITGPIIVLLARYIGKRFRKLASRIQGTVAGVTRTTEQAVFGQKIIKMFGTQQRELKRFRDANERDRRSRMKEAFTLHLSSPIIQIIVSIALGIIVYIAMNDGTAYNSTDNSVANSGLNLGLFSSAMSSGTFAAFMVAAGRLLQPLRAVPKLFNTLQKGIAAADEAFSVIDTQDEQDFGKPDLTFSQGDINIRELTFCYDPDKGNALQNISLPIKAGQTIALVGQSGSGKSTLANLIPRLYDWQQGQIIIDGQDIRNVNLASLRQQVALVSQDIILFDNTIANNIAYAGNYTDEQIRTAAEAANALEFIESLPAGFDTLVGERGVMLSGGQRQRISIARAILKDAPILILDEATSALDTESERKIQNALDLLMQGRTCIVIAHRLSTIEKANQIVVMRQGRIIERGSHQELLTNNQHYAQLHQLQFQTSPN